MNAELTTVSAYEMRDAHYEYPTASEPIHRHDEVTFFKEGEKWYARRLRWREEAECVGVPFFNGTSDVIEKGSTVVSARPEKGINGERLLTHSIWIVK